MKKKILLFVLFFVGIIASVRPNFGMQVLANDKSYVTLSSDDYRLEQEYLDFYAVGVEHFTYSNNGESRNGKVLSNAFDGNLSTYFESQAENVNGFVNSIEISFEKSVTLDRMIYGSEPGTTRGFPVNFDVYYKTSYDWVLIDNYIMTETTDLVLINFGESLEINALKLDYTKVHTRHRYTATAREIYFLQPESGSFSDYKNLFSDYSETTLSSKFSTLKSIEDFEKSLENNINFSASNAKINRAKAVLNGEVVFDKKKEMTTSPLGGNVIERYGDTANYSRNTLQLTSFGTNRQVTGILAYAGDTINVYVDGNENDPLPRVRFSQAMGHWRSWLSGEYQLKLGKNTFVVQDFVTSDYSESVPKGGAIYIVNPYIVSEQSENVKVYIDGGEFYPVFKAGMDETEYLNFLDEYAKKVEGNGDIINLTEIVSDHMISTVWATIANERFASYSPNTSIAKWNEYMDKLLEFGGIPQSNSDPLFDERNLHIRHNIRVAQPWAGAFMYAGGEHIGVLKGSQNSLIYGSGFGWGVTHEIGHALDNRFRTIGETSNNMWSKYNEACIENVGTRGDFANTTAMLSGDDTYDKVYNEETGNTSYFNSNRYNYLVWWYLETYQKGYWGNLENCYRGLNARLNAFYERSPSAKEKLNLLTETERQVFYSSIILGIDLTYYFDRWGYTIRNNDADPVFRESATTAEYKDVMKMAINSGYVDDDVKPKLWYQTNRAHLETSKSIYDTSIKAVVESVTKTDNGYEIKLPKSNLEGHLGYEILEGNDKDGYKVIGFTSGESFEDTIEYENGYTPNYKVVAYDTSYGTTYKWEKAQNDEQPKVNTLVIVVVAILLCVAIVAVAFVVRVIVTKQGAEIRSNKNLKKK